MAHPASIVGAAWWLAATRFVLAGLLLVPAVTARAGGLSAAEYFVGADPGSGNGIPLPASDGAFDSDTEWVQSAIDVAGLPAGATRIGLRFRDPEGAWGNALFLDVRVELSSDLSPDPALPPGGGQLPVARVVSAAEYSIDTASATSLAAADGDFDEMAEQTVAAVLNPGSLSPGTHRLALRFQDSEGRWGNACHLEVVVEENDSLVADPALPGDAGGLAWVRTIAGAEYALGGGPATSLAALDGGFDQVLEQTAVGAVDASSLAAGPHRLAMRFQDSEGRWGTDTFVDLVVEESDSLVSEPPLPPGGGGLASLRTIASAEYSLDGGPAAIAAALDGAYDEVTEQTVTIALDQQALLPGTRRLALRFRDSEGRLGTDTYLDVVVEQDSGLLPDPALPSDAGALAWVRTLAAAEVSLQGTAGVGIPARDGAYDAALEETIAVALDPALLEAGVYRLAMRFQDNEDRWGNETCLDLVVADRGALAADPALPPEAAGLGQLCSLAAAEVFLDEDPGEGNALACLPADEHFDSLTELLPSGFADVTTLASGSHRVGLRFKDCAGAWGAPIYLGLSVYNPFGTEPPAIAVQPPARQIQPPGGNAIFSILANGTEPLTYQWFKDGAILPGATNAWLHLAGLAAADAGGYQVLVANDYGSVTSRVALLIVRGATYAPEIVVQPVSQTVLAGAHVQLSALVDASWPVYYQWFKDGAALPGAVSTNLLFPAAQRSDSGVYWLVVTNDFGCAVTEPAQLNVDALMAFVGNEPLLGTNTFEGDVLVRFETVFENGTIFYTLDGSEPDFGAMAYAGPFAITRSSVLRAVAYNQTFTDWDEMVPVRVTIIPLLVLSASTAGGGAITLDPADGAYRRGTVVTVTATPAPGWTFMGWMGDVLSSDASLVLTMTNNRSLHAVFGTALAAIPSGSGAVLVEPEAAVYPFGAAVRLSAVPADGNFFVVWGGAASGTNNPLTFVVRNPNPTITCLFGVLGTDQFALAAVPNGFGRINSNPRGNRFPAGQQITLTAIPDPGQTFIGWAGDLAGTNNPQTLVLNSSKIVEALFTAWPTLQPDRENANLMQDGFRLLLKSEFGAPVSLMGSADFADWTPLLRVTNNFGTLRLLDASSAGVPYRFYRAVPE